jgi:hypothetical protein
MSLYGNRPVETGGSDDDREVVWFNFKENADLYSPENPFVYEGKLSFSKTKQSRFKDQRTGEFKEDRLVILDDGGDTKFGVSSSAAMFHREFDLTDPGTGELVAFRYSGKLPTRDGSSYHHTEFTSEAREARIASGEEKKAREAQKKASKPASVGKVDIPF